MTPSSTTENHIKTKILAIIGARPQFIKHSVFERAAKNKLDLITLHTGQHMDVSMNDVFFTELGMKAPDIQLSINTTDRSQRLEAMKNGIIEAISKSQPDIVLVYGDTDSTLAGALAAAATNTPLAHAEAGLRSYNSTMPEEYNRYTTDHLSQYLFCPSQKAVDNLAKEGITAGVHLVGDLMKDLVLSAAHKDPTIAIDFIYVSLHRPYNVDDAGRLTDILQNINALPHKIIFTLHPRTAKSMEEKGIDPTPYDNITFIPPQSYFDNLSYLKACTALITDSGGMQKEAYWLEKKCITLRSETEWPETLEGGGNMLVFNDLENIGRFVDKNEMQFDEYLYGDGKAGEKIVHVLQ